MLGSRSDGDIAPKLLAALEASVTVLARLRQEILNFSSANREQVENLAASIVRHISLFAGAENILPILSKLDQATSGVLALVPRDEKLRIDNEATLVVARRSAITLLSAPLVALTVELGIITLSRGWPGPVVSIDATPDFGVAVDLSCLTGVARAGERLVILLDIDRVLESAMSLPVSSTAALEN